MVHKCGRRLLQGWWWPVGPKLVFVQMAASVLEIMDGSLYLSDSQFLSGFGFE
jgi:hypothetical protein